MNKKYLIINADDFGLSEGVNKGIIDAHLNGVLTSTTMLVGGKFFGEAVDLAKKYPSLKVGIHLALTLDTSKPISDYKFKTLTKDDGTFKKGVEWIKDVDVAEAEIEFRAQIEKFLNSGLAASHLDSHHHIHCFHSGLNKLVQNLAIEYNLPVRQCQNKMDVLTTDMMYHSFHKEGVSIENLISILSDIKDHKGKYFEIMSHPAILDDYLESVTTYYAEREVELEILKSDIIKEIISEYNIELIGFDDIKK